MKEVTIILYHADWCGACKQFLPTWKKFKELCDNIKDEVKKKYDTKISCKEYEDTQNKEKIESEGIQFFPTLKVEYDDKPTIEIKRDIRSILESLFDLDSMNEDEKENLYGEFDKWEKIITENVNNTKFFNSVKKFAEDLGINTDGFEEDLNETYIQQGNKKQRSFGNLGGGGCNFKQNKINQNKINKVNSYAYYKYLKYKQKYKEAKRQKQN